MPAEVAPLSHRDRARQVIEEARQLLEPFEDTSWATRLIAFMSTTRYLVLQAIFIAAWMAINVILCLIHFKFLAWDPYPFILLNLFLSLQAAFAAPLILMSQSRSSEHQRRQTELTLAVGVLILEDVETEP